MSNLLSLTSAQLHKAAALKEKIDGLEQELASILGAPAETQSVVRRRKMSKAGRAKIAAAQKARWAKAKAAKKD